MKDPGEAIGAILKEALSRGGPAAEDKKKRPELKDELGMLKTAVDAYLAPMPFKVKDLVTPRPNSFYKQAGEAHIVLELRPTGEELRDFESENSSHNYGAKLDMRVACLVPYGKGAWNCLAYWVESWQFQKWEPKA